MDQKYMLMALQIAEEGIGKTNPNPLVGAVIVKGNKVIGKGAHICYGEAHAEINAIQSAKESLKGASLYVTLEPCSHYGKTPPCTEAIIKSGIKKVYVATLDPNPLVAGRGVESLRKNGVEVEVGMLGEECRKQNEVFFHYILHKTPFVNMKYAMTSDGKIATKTGASRWITGEEAREKVHRDRNKFAGIMVGVNTVIADDPMLDCRMEGGRNPVRIICDTNLKTPIDSRVVKTGAEIKTIIATAVANELAYRPYEKMGVEILKIGKSGNSINLKELMEELGGKQIDSIMIEGGSTLNFSAIEDRLVQRMQVYIAPKIFGGVEAKSPVGGKGFENIENCAMLKNQKISIIGEDILIESEVEYRCLQEL